MKPISTTPIAALLLICTIAFDSLAELSAGNVLHFNSGSNVSIEVTQGFWIDAPLQVASGVVIGELMADISIDTPFQLFEQRSQHVSSGPVSVIHADGNTAQLDFSTWAMTWKGIVIPLDSGGNNPQGEGIAVVQCDNVCDKGESFSLNYSATLPEGTEALGGLGYRLHLTGTIN